MKVFFGLLLQPGYYYERVPEFYKARVKHYWAPHMLRGEAEDKAFGRTRLEYRLSPIELGTILNGQKKL